MLVVKTVVFHGPNCWSKTPVLEAHVEFSRSEERSPSELSETVVALQALSGVPSRFLAPARSINASIHVLPFEFEEESLLRECLETALRLLNETPLTEPIDLQAERRRLEDLADHVRLGPSSRAILRAASARGIPYRRLNQGSLVQLGEGAYQRRIWTAETDATSAIAESIASDKQLTRSMLDAVGVNVPQGRSVVDREDAWNAAQEIGLPVVVKPRNGNHAAGVSLDLTDRESVLAAYDWACKAGTTSDVLVEQYIVGDHHRLLVIGDRMVAAAKGQREYVVGDGIRSVTALVDELNSDPRRGNNYSDLLDIVSLNESAAIVLDKQGLTFDSVPKLDQSVLIRHVGDLIEDCTDRVHPSTRQIAVLAAKTIGLDIAGMDLVAQDITRPLGEQRGCIIEVNAGPSLAPHVAPLIGSPQPVGEAVVDLLFPNNRASKIPTILLVNDDGNFEETNAIAAALDRIGNTVGIASDAPSKEQRDVRSLLMHPFLTAILLECSAQRVAAEGLSCSHAEIAVLPTIYFDAGNRSSSDFTVTTTLRTIHHLMASYGTILVYGHASSNIEEIAVKCGVPVSRVHCVSDERELIDRICQTFPGLTGDLRSTKGNLAISTGQEILAGAVDG